MPNPCHILAFPCLLVACTGGQGAGLSPTVLDGSSTDELAPGIWNEVRPGGDTLCAHGEPYAFFLYPGASDRLLIDFIGGGACWDEKTCGGKDVFEDSTDTLREYVRTRYSYGIYHKKRTDNPFHQDWHLMITYCTADIHWGDATVQYGDETVHHRGAANVRAALDFVYRALPAPSRVSVIGCSAGAYGAALWSAAIREHYGPVPMAVLGDSGAGIITDSFFRDSFPSWNAEAAFPRFIPSLDPTRTSLLDLSFVDVYRSIGAHFPDLRLGEFAHSSDAEQTLFFTRMGGSGVGEWRRRMLDSFATIAATTPSFASYVTSGNEHCITPSDELYSRSQSGVRFVDWLDDFVSAGDQGSVAR